MRGIKAGIYALACLGFAAGSTPAFSAKSAPFGVCDTLIVMVHNDCAENWEAQSYYSIEHCIEVNYADGPCADHWTRDPPNYNYDVVIGPVCRFYNPTVYGFCP